MIQFGYTRVGWCHTTILGTSPGADIPTLRHWWCQTLDGTLVQQSDNRKTRTLQLSAFSLQLPWMICRSSWVAKAAVGGFQGVHLHAHCRRINWIYFDSLHNSITELLINSKHIPGSAGAGRSWKWNFYLTGVWIILVCGHWMMWVWWILEKDAVEGKVMKWYLFFAFTGNDDRFLVWDRVQCTGELPVVL